VTATCDRLHCLLLGWEMCPEFVSLEGGTRERILRLPIIGILVHTAAGWVLLETGCDPRPYRGVETHDIYRVGLPEFPTDGDPLLDALAARGVAPDEIVAAAVSHLHLDHAGGLRHLAGRVPVTIQERELEFATQRAGRAEAYVREDRPIGYASDPADDALRRQSHDRLIALAAAENARLVPGHCPETWPPLAAITEGYE
jgi:glyoxylase-like metal-dependent hydrolase (beta-lactamase superfamily II)